jgi:hypothetical protein
MNVSAQAASSLRHDFDALDRLAEAFIACPRPEHFINFKHCEECAEHNETLQSQTPETLTEKHVGNAGWDPVCFVSSEGFAYFLPGLARLALEDSLTEWYCPQFLRHLISNGPNNARFMHCSQRQRRAVAEFVAYIIETRASRLDVECAADDAVHAFEIWSGNSGVSGR